MGFFLVGGAGRFYFPLLGFLYKYTDFSNFFKCTQNFQQTNCMCTSSPHLDAGLGVFFICLVLSPCHRMFKHHSATPLSTHLSLQDSSDSGSGTSCIPLVNGVYFIRSVFYYYF